MKRIWNLALGTAVLCTALLCGCALSGTTAPDSAAPTDPLTGQELQYPGERTAAVVIDNAASSTTWIVYIHLCPKSWCSMVLLLQV